MASQNLPSPELLRKLLRYEPETGKLYWLERPLSMFPSERIGRSWNTRFANKEAFTATSAQGYKVGQLLGRRQCAHRVIIAMTTGEWPKEWVDHDNRNRTDNRLKNIAPCSPSRNLRNTKLRRDNTSGVCGVHYCKDKRRWVASIAGDKGTIILGTFREKYDAVSARLAAEIEHGYHPNHGRSTQAQPGP